MRHRLILILTPLYAFLLCAACHGDAVTLDLEFDNTTQQWELYALIVPGAGASGDDGLAAARALIDNVDQNSTTLAANIGALDPLDPGGPNERPAVFPTAGGTLDIIYLQDLSDPPSVVTGVGVGGPSLIAQGGYNDITAPPVFGDDDFGRTSDGNFLNPIDDSSYGPSPPWDDVTLNVVNVSPVTLAGDYNLDDVVDAADYAVWRNRRGSVAGALPNDIDGGEIGAAQYLTWRTMYGASLAPVAGAQSAAPEPSGAVLLIGLLASSLAACDNRRSRRRGAL